MKRRKTVALAAITTSALILGACSGTAETTPTNASAVPSLVEESGVTPPTSAEPSSALTENSSPAPTTSAATSADAERDQAIALAIRDKLQQAYNGLPLDVSIDEESYLAIYTPIWESAQRYGFTLIRKPVPYVDGFTLSAEQAAAPGHTLMTELTSGLGTYCVASTEVLNPEILTEEQWEEAQELPREFLVIEGSCTPHVDWLAAILATTPASEPAPSATPTTAP